MTMKTRSEWIAERKRLLRGGYSSRKDYHIGKSIKYQAMCAMCGRPLVQYSYSTGDYTVVATATHMNYPSFYYVDLCKNADTCYNYYVSTRKES